MFDRVDAKSVDVRFSYPIKRVVDHGANGIEVLIVQIRQVRSEPTVERMRVPIAIRSAADAAAIAVEPSIALMRGKIGMLFVNVVEHDVDDDANSTRMRRG